MFLSKVSPRRKTLFITLLATLAIIVIVFIWALVTGRISSRADVFIGGNGPVSFIGRNLGSGVLIGAYNSSTNTIGGTKTDSSGNISILGMPAGNYWLVEGIIGGCEINYGQIGYINSQVDLSGQSIPSSFSSIGISKGLTVKVKDENGNEIEGAKVILDSNIPFPLDKFIGATGEDYSGQEETTNIKGIAEFGDSLVNIRLGVFKTGFESVTQNSVSLTPCIRNNVDVVLKKKGPSPSPTVNGSPSLQYVYGHATITALNGTFSYISGKYNNAISFVNTSNGQRAPLYSTDGSYNQVLTPGLYEVQASINGSTIKVGDGFTLKAWDKKPLDINVNFPGNL